MFECFTEMQLVRAGASGSLLNRCWKLLIAYLLFLQTIMFNNIQPFASNRMEALSH
jgi:hypothetical protein